MNRPTLLIDARKAQDRLENALGELEAAEKVVGSLRGDELLQIDENQPFKDWMPLVTRGKVCEARDAAASAIDKLEVAMNYIHELECLGLGKEGG